MSNFRAALAVALLAVALGAAHPALDGRIVDGQQVSITRHPYQVALRFRGCNTCAYTHSCGGSLLAADVVLCAAQCLNNRDSKNLLIVAGSNIRNGGSGYVSRIEKFIMHEQYNPNTYDNDVALLFLQTPLRLDGIYMAPIALATQMPPAGTTATISGFGTTTEGGSAEPLMKAVDVSTVSQWECDGAYGVGRITPSMLCAGDLLGGKDSCQGDAGGPLVVKGQLLGVISWGRGCGRPGFPGVYANIPYLKPWIEKHMAAHRQ